MIRPLQSDDLDGWMELWKGYLRYYRHELPDEVTRAVFARLCAGEQGMYGLLAVDDAGGDAIGFAHCVVHASTWSTASYCCLEDLFVGRAGRGGGVGEQLIQAVYAHSTATGVEKVYWHTEEYNAPARSLYDSVAHRTSFIMYEKDAPFG
jgi:GNAT superfamily N-acetyltransferase